MTHTNPPRGRVRIMSHKIPPATFNCNQLLKQRRQSQAHILPLLLFRVRSNTSLGPNLPTSVIQRGVLMTWLASLVGTLHLHDPSPVLPFFALWAPWTERWWCLSPYWYLYATGLLTAAAWFSGPAIIISWWVLLLTSLHSNHFSTVHCDLFAEPRNDFGWAVPLELLYGEPGVPGLDWSRTEKFLYNHKYSSILVLQNRVSCIVAP